ncbi:hypothetical protein OEZ78_27370, partial [Leclercia adecarboxylata]|uniref:hypothetical protein n=1 Tax=Leclercia adecarboxylata TaxID=83655 RepID=UPI00234C0F3B
MPRGTPMKSVEQRRVGVLSVTSGCIEFVLDPPNDREILSGIAPHGNIGMGQGSLAAVDSLHMRSRPADLLSIKMKIVGAIAITPWYWP